jgi:hypothetical protein
MAGLVSDPILSDQDLTELRDVVMALLPDTATVLDEVEVRDTTGGIKTTWSPRPDTIACRVGNVQQADQVAASTANLGRGNQVAGRMRVAITVPALTQLDIGDRLVVFGQTYTILGVLGPMSWELTRRLIAEVV